MDFESFNLSPGILRAVEEMNYRGPTPIQEKAIPHVLGGRDLVGSAQTGTGKTAAFALPILHRLYASPRGGHGRRTVRVLVLAPTRELATQIGESFGAYGRHVGVRHAAVYGGVSQHPQAQALHRGVDILVATPGRLLDLMGQGIVTLRAVEVLVLDEADRMLDMGFIDDIRRIVSEIPGDRQTLFFSATMPPEIRRLAGSILRDPVSVSVAPVSSPAEAVDHLLYYVEKPYKGELLRDLLSGTDIRNALVFTRTRHGAERLSRQLARAGVRVEAIHGDKTQKAREKALAEFKRGAIRVLVATDVAARGIDIIDLSHVINFDLPEDPESYIHRIGRTGRAGASGIALSLCGVEERPLLAGIERLVGKHLRVIEDHPFRSTLRPGTPTALEPRRPKTARPFLIPAESLFHGGSGAPATAGGVETGAAETVPAAAPLRPRLSSLST